MFSRWKEHQICYAPGDIHAGYSYASDINNANTKTDEVTKYISIFQISPKILDLYTIKTLTKLRNMPVLCDSEDYVLTLSTV